MSSFIVNVESGRNDIFLADDFTVPSDSEVVYFTDKDGSFCRAYSIHNIISWRKEA